MVIYANEGGDELNLLIRHHVVPNTRFQFVLVYTLSREAKDAAVAAAVGDGALSVGEDAGLPLLRFPLEQTGDAHGRGGRSGRQGPDRPGLIARPLVARRRHRSSLVSTIE